MDLIIIIMLAVAQGLTEFLPVSSSGHIILLSELTGYSSSLALGIFLHLGTLFAVVIVLFPSIKRLLHPPYKRLFLLILATIPAGVAGLLANDLIDSLFSDGRVLPFTFFATSVLLFLSQSVKASRRPLSVGHTLSMGIGQTLALLPGLSRSGTTIASGLISGADKEEVGEFSFLMSIPIIAGGAIVEIYKALSNPAGAITTPVSHLLIGMLISCIVGLVVIKKMLDIVKKRSFTPFIIYLTALSAVCFVNYYLIPIW